MQEYSMLAYVFWHWPRQGTDPKTYETRLVQFQRALASVPIAGLCGSAVFRVPGAPWFPQGTAGYEDVYLLENSCAMDALNETAVCDACRGAHDQAVEFCAAGAGGLYALRHGQPSLQQMTRRYWLAKPRSVGYAQFDAEVLPAVSSLPFALWRRQMVLGPTPEFCLQTADEVNLPSGLVVSQIQTELICYH
jgi:hypothetical protein